MLKFKEFLLNEDLGIGPEGTSKNPSIKNYMDSLKKEKKDLTQQKKLSVGSPEEKERLGELLQQKTQEIQQTKLLSNPATVDKATPQIPSTMLPTSTPSAKESAFDRLIRGKPSTTVSPTTLSTSMASPDSGSPETSIYSGYKVSGSLGGSMLNPELDVEVRGKTSKNLRL
jgi:hypothetical protein